MAAGVVQELDFRNEAANGMEFKKSLGFLGYVDVPDTLPELTTRRAMAQQLRIGISMMIWRSIAMEININRSSEMHCSRCW